MNSEENASQASDGKGTDKNNLGARTK